MTGDIRLIERLMRPLLLARKLSGRGIARLKGLDNYFKKVLQEESDSVSAEVLKRAQTLVAPLEALDDFPESEKAEKLERFLKGMLALRGEVLSRAYEESQKALFKDVQYLKGVGPRIAAYLRKKDIHTVRDLLFMTPRRFEDRRELLTIARLQPGRFQVTSGTVELVEELNFGGRRVFEVVISDGTGFLSLKWFNFNRGYMRKTYRRGIPLVVSGEVRIFRGHKEMVHPDVEFGTPGPEALGYMPVYPEIEGIHGKHLRRIVKRTVEDYARYVISVVPVEVEHSAKLMSLSEAVRAIHEPELFCGDDRSPEDVFREARRRVLFEELFILEVGMALRKKQFRSEKAVALKVDVELFKRFIDSLPFKLTRAQRRVIEEINSDLGRASPMNRLLQGDVGSGNTVVAMAAASVAIGNGYQVAVMAPTEILAEQHYQTFVQAFSRLGVQVCLLTSSLRKAQRQRYLRLIRQGDIHIVVGTHAIIQEDVGFKNLILGIVDEQHRFGVVQRARLRQKGVSPHILVMTATPIPRTLAMTIYGDLDISVIDEMPPGRKPVITRIYRENQRSTPYTFMRQLLEKGFQGYVVLPLIEESEKLDLRSAIETYEKLSSGMFARFNVGLLHGRLPSDEREEIMRRFKEGEIQLLVATTVIEVGIDVPNAAVMIVENAERFGLSQLHQLRGRVGRGREQAYMFLVYSSSISRKGISRLKIMEETTDGFKIAEKDLEIRGPGEIFGTRQWGIPDSRMMEMLADPKLLSLARKEAFKVVSQEYALSEVERDILYRYVHAAWGERLELARTG